MNRLLLKNGRVISPADSLDGVLDVLVEGGSIARIEPQIDTVVDDVLDATGQVVAPGFIDLHVHLREPGGEISETIESGLAAAVAGGFTSVCAMPNTRPVNDNAASTRALTERAAQLGLARVFPIATVTLGSAGEELSDLAALVGAGAVAFSDDGRPIKTAGLARKAMAQASALGVFIDEHCEEPSLSFGGVINEGLVADRLGVKGIPNSSEEVCLARDIVLAQETAAHLHVAHLSTAGSVEIVRQAKRRGLRVTCEATPHHFTLTDEAVLEHGTNAKMNPPLGSAADVAALVGGIADGTIDCIATDHAPHAPELKAAGLAEAPFGVIGLETAIGVALTQLVHTGRVSLWHLITLMSTAPARIIQQPLGTLAVGALADITVLDPQLEWTYRTAEGRSKSRNSPFEGWRLRGRATATIVSGRVAYRLPFSRFSPATS